jgi:hypothetical protein
LQCRAPFSLSIKLSRETRDKKMRHNKRGPTKSTYLLPVLCMLGHHITINRIVMGSEQCGIIRRLRATVPTFFNSVPSRAAPRHLKSCHNMRRLTKPTSFILSSEQSNSTNRVVKGSEQERWGQQSQHVFTLGLSGRQFDIQRVATNGNN